MHASWIASFEAIFLLESVCLFMLSHEVLILFFLASDAIHRDLWIWKGEDAMECERGRSSGGENESMA